MQMNTFTLNNGIKIPCIGYGTYKVVGDTSKNDMKMALEAGYRYLDTASFYGNEKALGQAIRESGIKREDIFISSKAWKDELGYENVKKAFAQTLERLQMDYLDLYLIHWPMTGFDCENWKEVNLKTWRAMEELYDEGKIRAIGVSNFLPQHLLDIMKRGRIKPAVNQIEFHPGYTQEATVHFCQEHGILVQAWSPMGRMSIMHEPLLQNLAEKYQVSPVQICLKYALQRNVLPLPKSSSMERMQQNMDLFGFEISEEDMWYITTLPLMGWSGQHPDRARVRFVESRELY